MKALFSPLSIAPMVDWTYSHFRVFMRILAPNALLYTDMQTYGAIVNNPQRAIHFHPMENPLALQLGGSCPKELAHCAILAEEAGFDEINLNLGCPSDRVQAGRFGACLMKEPEQVKACVKAMKQVVSIPVSTKIRIGVDEQDSYEFFSNFAYQLVDAGSDKLIVHARKAWLHGLNPKQNRSIPTLHYPYVYNLKQSLPDIPIVINGNIQELAEVEQHMQQVDAVMLGRLACQNPYALTAIHQFFYPELPKISRHSAFLHYLEYLQTPYAEKAALSCLIKPILSLAHGLPRAKVWKEQLMDIQSKRDRARLADCADILFELEQI